MDGRSQARVHGHLLAYEERGGAGWIDAAVEELAPGVRARRTVVVMPDYLLDEVSWSATREVTFDLPIHVDGEFGDETAWQPARLTGGPTSEDGFGFVHDAQTSAVGGGPMTCLTACSGEKRLDAWVDSDQPAEWWRATAPGPPGADERRFHLVRVRSGRGTVRCVWSWRGAVTGVAVDAERVQLSFADGTQHVHSRREDGWRVDLLAAGARSSIDLGGLRRAQRPEPASIGLYGDATTAAAPAPAAPLTLPRTFSLGERHYRRSEESWHEAGAPTAIVFVAMDGPDLRIDAEVVKAGEPVFVAAEATNRYDNEAPDINGDGLQVYLRTSGGSGAWVLVPESRGGSVRVRAIVGWGDLSSPRASWRRTERGYAIRLAVRLGTAARGPAPIELDVIINETAPGRERRRGQLVMSGAAGEFVYLAGDRHDPARLLRFLPEP